MQPADIDRLRSVKTLTQLLAYLRDELDWPIGSDPVEDVTFDYDPAELGFNAKATVHIKEVKQLRPLNANQPWGIFWVNFEKKRLPVVMLRRALGHLVIRKRATAGRSDQKAWQLNDLLFISAYGEDHDRAITFAHFSEGQGAPGELPVLKVLGWDDADTLSHVADVQRALTEKLRWPSKPADVREWRRQWAEAFTLRHREVITTTELLVNELARLATIIRDAVLVAVSRETEKGPWRRLLAAFQSTLIRDLTEDSFADVIAQTISYGLLTARFSASGTITLRNLVDMVPRTNPFLKELLEVFLTSAGRRGLFDVDEVGIDEVVSLLNRANADAIKHDFGNRTSGEDPVIHFYEHFLGAYNKQLKVQRGVFYTPQPVVSYIVRSVHELLQTEFGLADGLADTTTWGEMLKKHAGLKLPALTDEPGEERTISPDEPFVVILDPATGTATFLVEAIEVIHRTLVAKWNQQRLTGAEQRAAWNEYVPKHLLPRLHAFELMMAPYAIAHMKIGLKLAETGYNFATEQRARIYLTNALEPWMRQPPLIGFDALAHEAAAVNEIKRHKRFTVVIGNPPYSASISEPEWLMRKLDDWKQGLNETKSDLNREEWKFLRLAQHLCEATGAGILGYIINRDFLDGIVKRRMREHLAETFPLRVVVDLNGDVKGNIADGNVFDIEQGVAIAIFCTHHAVPRLRFVSRVGTREEKYADLLAKQPIDTALADVEARPPYFRWLPYASEHSAAAAAEYVEWPQIKAAFGVASSGIQTKRDGLCVAFTRKEIWERVQRFEALPAGQAREQFDLGPDGRDWSVVAAQSDIRANGPDKHYVSAILYRPFDIRFTYWTGKTKGFLAYPRREVMQHVVGRHNLGMIFNRQIAGDSVSHFGVSRIPICHGTFYLGNKGQDYFAPVFVFDEDLLASQESGRSNFTPLLQSALKAAIGADVSQLTPEDIFHYAYAVFHSPGYRSRYAEFLKIDFPRLPLTGNLELFRALAQLGGELTALHLLESPKVAQPITEFIGGGHPEVERISWSRDTVWVDKAQTTGFQGVRENVWNFHVGGYQVCEKWLKDRKGYKLSNDDLGHYQKVVIALAETIRLMGEIDEVIDSHGGWPGAFGTGPVQPRDEAPVEENRDATERLRQRS